MKRRSNSSDLYKNRIILIRRMVYDYIYEGIEFDFLEYKTEIKYILQSGICDRKIYPLPYSRFKKLYILVDLSPIPKSLEINKSIAKLRLNPPDGNKNYYTKIIYHKNGR